MGKHPEGMFYDLGTECFWIYFPNGVYSLSTQFEDEEVWKLLVERNEYVEALGTAKKYNSPYYGHVFHIIIRLLDYMLMICLKNSNLGKVLCNISLAIKPFMKYS